MGRLFGEGVRKDVYEKGCEKRWGREKVGCGRGGNEEEW